MTELNKCHIVIFNLMSQHIESALVEKSSAYKSKPNQIMDKFGISTFMTYMTILPNLLEHCPKEVGD